MGLSALGLLPWILYLLYLLILAIPGGAVYAGSWAYGLVVSGGSGISNGVGWVKGQPYTYLALGGIVLIFLIIRFFRSTAWAVTRLKFRSWKNNHCWLIRVE